MNSSLIWLFRIRNTNPDLWRDIVFDMLPALSAIVDVSLNLLSCCRMTLTRKERIFFSEILARICLSEDHYISRAYPPRLSSAPCGNAKTQGHIVHAIHNDALMLRTILTPSPNVRLDNIASVQERHLTVCLDPHLVSRVRRNNIQRCDVQPELASLCELAKAGAQREKCVARDGGS